MSLHINIIGEAEARAAIDAEGSLSVAERKVMATEASNLTKRWFRDRNATHAHTYPVGGTRSNFWQDAARATTWDVNEDTFRVLVAKLGVGIHYHGGDVEPSGRPSSVTGKPISTLAIPATADAYDHVPADFTNLHVTIYKAQNKAALSLPNSGLPLFWLVKSVHLQEDTSVLPGDDLYFHVVMNRLQRMRGRNHETAVEE